MCRIDENFVYEIRCNLPILLLFVSNICRNPSGQVDAWLFQKRFIFETAQDEKDGLHLFLVLTSCRLPVFRYSLVSFFSDDMPGALLLLESLRRRNYYYYYHMEGATILWYFDCLQAQIFVVIGQNYPRKFSIVTNEADLQHVSFLSNSYFWDSVPVKTVSMHVRMYLRIFWSKASAGVINSNNAKYLQEASVGISRKLGRRRIIFHAVSFAKIASECLFVTQHTPRLLQGTD